MATEFVTRWKTKVSKKPVRPGIYRLEAGGFLVVAKVTDPKAPKGKDPRVFVSEVVPGTVQEAQSRRDALVVEKRLELTGLSPKRQLFNFCVASRVSLKCLAAGTVKSAKGKQTLESIVRVHLFPFFKGKFCDEVTVSVMDAWRAKLQLMIAEGYESTRLLRNGKTQVRFIHLSPETANVWMARVRNICSEMAALKMLPSDPSIALKPFDTSQVETHTIEDPNALTGAQLGLFLRAMRELFPQHFAMTLLGFLTGKRPSTLRPLRAHGQKADVLWEQSIILFRRSHTVRDEILIGTKTLKKEKERVGVPAFVLEELRAHLALIQNPGLNRFGQHPMWWRKPMLESELLFPGRDGGFRAPSVLDGPFRTVSEHIGLPYVVTPKSMRRTFNDLCREVGVHDVVKMSICGHETTEMSNEVYSTARYAEHRDAITRIADVIDLSARRAFPPPRNAPEARSK